MSTECAAAKPGMSANDLRQCLRIAGGGTLAFFLCKLFDAEYGALFCIYPVLLLGLVPRLNRHVVRQFVAQGLVVNLRSACCTVCSVTGRCC